MRKRTGYKIPTLFGLIFLISSVSIRLYSQVLSDTIHIREVTIIKPGIANENAFSRINLDSFALTRAQSLSLSELLNQYSSVYVKSTGRGTLSTASIRGTGASHTKVYWNGILINSPMLGQTDLSLIPVCFLDNVSIYPSGSSLLQGSGALGGIISLENKPGWDTKTDVSLRSEFASFQTSIISGKLSIHKNNWISSSRAYHNHSGNNYPYLNTHIKPNEIERLRNGDYMKSGVLQEIYYRIKNNDLLSVRFMWQNSGRNLPQPMSYEGVERKEYQQDRNLLTHLSWKHYGRAGQFELSSAWIENKMKYQLSLSENNLINIYSNSYEKCFINRFNYFKKFGSETDFRTQVSYNYYQVGIKEKVRSEGYQTHRSDLSVMFGVQHIFSGRIHTYFLIRDDFNGSHFLPVMPSAGIAIRALNKTELWLKTNLSRNYRYPALNELHWIPGGNARLKPEESLTADVSADLTFQNGVFSFNTLLNAYYSRINDWILWKPTQYGYWSPENLALVQSRGLEFSIKSTIFFHTSKISIHGNYNLSRTTNENPSHSSNRSLGKQLIYIPVHSGNLHFGIAHNGFYMNYSLYMTGKRYTQTNNADSFSATVLDPYLLNDFSLGKNILLEKINAGIRIGINNIFNTSYQVILARPMPGRNYFLVLEVSF